MRTRVAWLVASAALLFSTSALADKVAVLKFTGADVSNDTAAHDATQRAVAARGNTLPNASEMVTAEVAVKDTVPDNSTEYIAAGKASTSDWTVAGRVGTNADGYHLELEVCQVQSGRVESLSRDVDPAQADQQINEMLALLLRPEGIANAAIPWERGVKKKPPPPKPVPPPPPPPPPVPPPPPPPPPAPAVRHTYAEHSPFAVGVVGEGLSAVSRPGRAEGPVGSFELGGALGYAIDAVPGLEIRADGEFAAAGPGAVFFDAGARYAFMLVPTARIFAGPEAALGGFFTTGADKATRFLARGSVVAGIGVGDHLQLELFGDAAAAAGGSGALIFLGGGARALVRF
ncbi:MAG: hypothetical protein ABI183_14495 [Polyangiaceae bacterium]